MTAGLNCRAKLIRIGYGEDDSVGGAVVTGTATYFIRLRIQAEPEQQLILQQGLETQRTFTGVVSPGIMYDIRERDEIEVIEPKDDVYYGKRFRITSVLYSSHNKRDPRNYMILGLVRSVRAHGSQ